MTRILIVNGHPDAHPGSFVAALAAAYAKGALAAGHEIRRIDIGALNLPPVHSAAEFAATPAADSAAAAAQRDIAWCEHLVIVHPLWLGSQPAALKAFFEQTFRYGFALPKTNGQGYPKGLLTGRSARFVVTMGMPAFIYRWWFGAFAVRALESAMLKLSGISPVRRTLIGGMGALVPATAQRHLAALEALGRRAR